MKDKLQRLMFTIIVFVIIANLLSSCEWQYDYCGIEDIYITPLSDSIFLDCSVDHKSICGFNAKERMFVKGKNNLIDTTSIKFSINKDISLPFNNIHAEEDLWSNLIIKDFIQFEYHPKYSVITFSDKFYQIALFDTAELIMYIEMDGNDGMHFSTNSEIEKPKWYDQQYEW